MGTNNFPPPATGAELFHELLGSLAGREKEVHRSRSDESRGKGIAGVHGTAALRSDHGTQDRTARAGQVPKPLYITELKIAFVPAFSATF